MNWEKWSDEIGKHIKAIQDEAVEDYRQQLLKAVEEMRYNITGIEGFQIEDPRQMAYKTLKNEWLGEVIDLLKAKDYIQEFDNQIPREGL